MNPYLAILADPNVTDAGTDRDIRQFCKAAAFDPAKPLDPNPYKAVLALGVPNSIATHRRMSQRLEQLAAAYRAPKEKTNDTK